MSASMHVLRQWPDASRSTRCRARSRSRSASTRASGRAPSRQHLSGLAHLVEHMVFKGAGGRDTRALAEAIEDVGGSLNAWTARDQTVFHGRALARDTAARRRADRRPRPRARISTTSISSARSR